MKRIRTITTTKTTTKEGRNYFNVMSEDRLLHATETTSYCPLVRSTASTVNANPEKVRDNLLLIPRLRSSLIVSIFISS
jgi:hypothetical protein